MNAALQYAADRRGASAQTDPVVTAINAYLDGLAAYNASPDDDHTAGQRAAQTYEQPLDVLQEWTAPAISFAGAVAALRLAKQELTEFRADPMALAMLTAALDFLDRPAREFDLAVVEFRKAAIAFDPTIINLFTSWEEPDDDRPGEFTAFAGLYPNRSRKVADAIADARASATVEGGAT